MTNKSYKFTSITTFNSWHVIIYRKVRNNCILTFDIKNQTQHIYTTKSKIKGELMMQEIHLHNDWAWKWREIFGQKNCKTTKILDLTVFNL